MKTIFISRNGQEEGPFSEEEINSLLASSELTENDFIWCEGLTDWRPVSEMLNHSNDPVIEECAPTVSEAVIPNISPNNNDSSSLSASLNVEPAYIHLMEEAGGELHVYDDRVSITPKGIIGFLSKGLKGTKTIPFYSITAIQFKQAGLMKGYLQFTIPGGNESHGGAFAAVSDENTFVFDEANNNKAVVIKNFIEARIKEIRTSQSVKPAAVSLGDELTKLAALKTQGLLSDEEFQAAKKRLIG